MTTLIAFLISFGFVVSGNPDSSGQGSYDDSHSIEATSEDNSPGQTGVVITDIGGA